MVDTKLGTVIHFYDKLSVAIVKLNKPLKVGDTLNFKHGDQEFTQKIASMEIDRKQVQSAKKGDEVGIKVDQPAKEKTQVYKL